MAEFKTMTTEKTATITENKTNKSPRYFQKGHHQFLLASENRQVPKKIERAFSSPL
jgi:hypothetical protein